MASTVWRGRLAFGMVSIPVKLYKAARRERVRFQHVYRPSEPVDLPPEAEPDFEPPPEDPPVRTAAAPFAPSGAGVALAPVKNMPVAEMPAARQTPVERTEILKGFEIEKDRFVTFEPREIAAIRPRTSTELAITEFVRLEEIDPIYFETSYYAAADRDGERAYALLFKALEETRYAAIGSLAMHGREHATVIRPGKHGLIVHTLFYENEVRSNEEYWAGAAVVGRELELAKQFVHALAASFDPSKLKDSYEERLHELIQARAGTAIAMYEQPEAAKHAPVIDIMDALRKSLEMAKKPPSRETAPAKKAKSGKSRASAR